MRLDRIEPLGPLFSTTWTHPDEHEEPLIRLPAGDVRAGFGQLMVEGNRLSPAWEFLVRTLEPLDWLRERYPELYEEGEPPAAWQLRPRLLHLPGQRRQSGDHVLRAGARRGLGPPLHRDAGLRARLAAVLRLTPDDFLKEAAAAIRDAAGWGGGWTSRNPAASPTIMLAGTMWPE